MSAVFMSSRIISALPLLKDPGAYCLSFLFPLFSTSSASLNTTMIDRSTSAPLSCIIHPILFILYPPCTLFYLACSTISCKRRCNSKSLVCFSASHREPVCRAVINQSLFELERTAINVGRKGKCDPNHLGKCLEYISFNFGHVLDLLTGLWDVVLFRIGHHNFCNRSNCGSLDSDSPSKEHRPQAWAPALRGTPGFPVLCTQIPKGET